jgi:cardiolipin synthase
VLSKIEIPVSNLLLLYVSIKDESTLINKALSGVDVRIILPEVADKKFVYGVTRNNAEKLIDYGVKVFVMKNSFVHSKLLLTENSVVVGSINMDLRSFYQQFESAVYTDDDGVMKSVLSDFENTMEVSYHLTEENKLRKHFIYRIFAGLMQIFAPFM